MSESRKPFPVTADTSHGSPGGSAHDELCDGGATQASFAPRPESIAAARNFVAAQTGLTGRSGQDAALVTSELASNAVTHASTHFEVSIREHSNRVRIAVTDGNPQLPRLEPENPPTAAISGRGLRIVSQLAERWGVEPRGCGKAVWAELRVLSNDRTPHLI